MNNLMTRNGTRSNAKVAVGCSIFPYWLMNGKKETSKDKGILSQKEGFLKFAGEKEEDYEG